MNIRNSARSVEQSSPGLAKQRSPWRVLINTSARLSILLDLAIIVAVALLFARPILNFDESVVPAGVDDWEDASASMELARESILEHAEFPLWNPYFGTGFPYMGEPKVYLLNPVASVPSLILGTLNGSKVAAAASMIVAGLGMYYLAAVMGLSRPLRVWSGLTMAMSGSIAARVYGGHFNLLTGLPFVPLVFALALQALRRPSFIYPMFAGLAAALLFLSGQVYYTVFAIPGLLLTFLFVLAAEGWHERRWSLGRAAPVVGRGLATGLWTLGFSAIQLLPYLDSRSAISAPRYPDLRGSQTVVASAQNFFTSDVPDLEAKLGLLDGAWHWWEYYSYVGLVPLLGLALVIVALRNPAHRFPILWATTLFGLYLAWSAAPHTFFQRIYDTFPWLYQLRAPSRTLAFAAPFLVILAALGLQHATDLLWEKLRWPSLLIASRATPGLRLALGPVLALLLIAFSFYGLRDVFDSNRAILQKRPRFNDRALAVQWLRERDPSVFYVAAPDLGEAVPPEFYRQGIKRLDARWEYRFARPLPPVEPDSLPVSIVPVPKYLVGGRGEIPADAEAMAVVNGRTVYHLTQSPYYASTLSSEDPPTDESYPWRVKTSEAGARVLSANVIEVWATPPPGHDRLLVLESFHSGWRLEIDGRREGAPENYGGFLSTTALPGSHTYTFVFDPKSFRCGMAVTAGTVLGAVLLLSSRLAARWRRKPPSTQTGA